MSKYRILMLHNHYRIRGGEDESTESELRLLREAGHSVEILRDNSARIGTEISKLQAGIDTIWSRRWFQRVDSELKKGRFDIVHVQNFYPLISPSVYYAARRNGAKVVQAIRNYRLVCPSANLFREGRYCDDCVGKSVKIPGVIRKCYNDSVFESALVAGMSGVHKLLPTWRRHVDAYVAVSQFVKDKLVLDGFPARRIHVKPNFAYESGSGQVLPRRDMLFVGRITPEKGLGILLDAWSRLQTEERLLLAGEAVSALELPSNVIHLGRLPSSRVRELMHEVRCVVMPGVWPEPFGRVAIEAFSCGTPVIATHAGGLAAIVEDGVNGFVVDPGDVAGLSERLSRLLDGSADMASLSANARKSFLTLYTPQVNLQALESIYSRLFRNAGDDDRDVAAE